MQLEANCGFSIFSFEERPVLQLGDGENRSGDLLFTRLDETPWSSLKRSTKKITKRLETRFIGKKKEPKKEKKDK